MRFLRMLTNALLAGALGAAYLTILVLQLNPQVPLALGDDVAARTACSRSSTASTSRVLFYVADACCASSSASHALSPGWVSVRLLAWLAAVVAPAPRC